MAGGIWGGGVVLAVAAGLWLAYLVPSWLRRREYVATERNAVRLQQALRALAETAEVPEEVRVEATARDAAAQERILRKARERAEAQAKVDAKALAKAEAKTSRWSSGDAKLGPRREGPRAARERRSGERWGASPHKGDRTQRDADRSSRSETRIETSTRTLPDAITPVLVEEKDDRMTDEPPVQRMSGVRRARAATSLVLLVAMLAMGYGAFALLTTGTWSMLAIGGGLALASLTVLTRLARVRRRRVVRQATRMPSAAQVYDVAETDGPVAEARPTWTPRPLPKPLYMSEGTMAANTMASAAAAEQLRKAAAEAELALRAAELEPEVTRFRPRPSAEPAATTQPVPLPESAPSRWSSSGQGPRIETSPVTSYQQSATDTPARDSRYAAMGVLTDADDEPSIDLDAALRRRRAG